MRKAASTPSNAPVRSRNFADMDERAAGEVAECALCGLLQRTGPLETGEAAVCPRCGAEVRRRKRRSILRTRALSLAGLLFYGPANYFPLVRVEYHGLTSNVTLWSSVRALLEQGQWAVGVLVFKTSILTPAVKLLALFLISVMAGSGQLRRSRMRLYQIVTFVNPWNMLEVFMVAFVIGIVKFGKVATITPGIGAWSFAALVVLTIAAAEVFDPRMIWDEEAA